MIFTPALPLPFLLLTILLLPSPILSAPSPPPNPNPINYTSLTCPPPSSPSATLPTPTYGTHGASFVVCAELVIAAPPALVYAALVDFPSYPLWNSFVVSAVAEPQSPSFTSTSTSTSPEPARVGTRLTFTSRGLLGPGLDARSDEIVTVLRGPASASASAEEDYLLAAWRYDDGLSGAGSRAEHPNVLVGVGGAAGTATRLVSYETYYEGLYTGAVALLRGALQERFEAQARDLKAYVEGGGGGSGEGR